MTYDQQTFEHMLWAVHRLSTLFVRGDDTLFIEFCFRDKKVEKTIYFARLPCEALERDMDFQFRNIARQVLDAL